MGSHPSAAARDQRFPEFDLGELVTYVNDAVMLRRSGTLFAEARTCDLGDAWDRCCWMG